MSSSVATATEIYRQYSDVQKTIQTAKAVSLLGKWVVADPAEGKIFFNSFSFDEDFATKTTKALKTIWRVAGTDGIMVLDSRGQPFWARYIKEVVFQQGDPSQEEIEMYTMLGYEILP